MKIFGDVTEVKLAHSYGGDERRLITIRLPSGGELTMKVKPHEAKAYRIGREVLLRIKPE